jgi:hypothetical protein
MTIKGRLEPPFYFWCDMSIIPASIDEANKMLCKEFGLSGLNIWFHEMVTPQEYLEFGRQTIQSTRSDLALEGFGNPPDTSPKVWKIDGVD